MKTKNRIIRILLLLSFLFFIQGSGIHAADKLKGYSAHMDSTSVSGLSSGGFMATQFHVAYSNSLMGAGVVAGGPYYCSGCNELYPYIINAQTACMKPILSGPDPEFLLEKAEGFEKEGFIDSLENLKDDKIYIFSGTRDTVVKQKVVDQTVNFYKLAGVPESSIEYVSGVPSGHAFITDNPHDNRCSANKSPYINNCNIKQAMDILSHIYGDLNQPAKKLSSFLTKFDQTEFADIDQASMNSYGFVYVPKDCEKGGCRIHISLHGCQQGADTLEALYAATTGYNEVADTNRIIVIYPQASSSMMSPMNPQGCWDFWGYSSTDSNDPDFYKKSAIQMQAFKKMVDRLKEPAGRR